MKEVLNLDVNTSVVSLNVVPVSGSKELNIYLSHWEGAAMDMDLAVSYDDCQTWMYGGGCKGAISDKDGIEFHLKYGQTPTHIKGLLRSDEPMNTTLRITQGD